MRTVKVRTARGKYTRSIVKVIPLEAQLVPSYFMDPAMANEPVLRNPEIPADTLPFLQASPEMESSRGNRPQRAAATAARKKFREQLE